MKAYYYVYQYNYGAPRVRHLTLAKAMKEAERLARANPGTAFEILKCVAISQVATVSTFWMDGEEPE